MPHFTITWRVAWKDEETIAKKEVDWGFVPAPGTGLIPFTDGASVLMQHVDVDLDGSAGSIFLEPFQVNESERYHLIRQRLEQAAWVLR